MGVDRYAYNFYHIFSDGNMGFGNYLLSSHVDSRSALFLGHIFRCSDIRTCNREKAYFSIALTPNVFHKI